MVALSTIANSSRISLARVRCAIAAIDQGADLDRLVEVAGGPSSSGESPVRALEARAACRGRVGASAAISDHLVVVWRRVRGQAGDVDHRRLLVRSEGGDVDDR
ncbi:MAG: hypothetical protein H6692_04890 [Gemmatimonadales bacterium]|nr:hypothetical protein [Gemmatimonadales bacterium]